MSNLKNAKGRKIIFLILDLFFLNVALLGAFFLRFETITTALLDYDYFIVVSIMGLLSLYFKDLYSQIWKYASIKSLLSLTEASVITNVGLLLYAFFREQALPRSIPLLNLLLIIFLLGGWRFSLRLFNNYFKRKRFNGKNKPVLIVGAGDAAEIIVREMNKHPELKKEVIGLIDDNPAKHNLELHGIPVLGDRQQIPELIEDYNVQEVIIAIPSAPGKEIKEIYELSKQKEVEVNIVPGVYELLNGDVHLNQIREVQVEDLLRRDPINLDPAKIASYIEGKTVLVTGGGGSIGSELCRQLSKFNPERLLIFDINENTSYFLQRELNEKYPNLDVYTLIGSIRDKEKVKAVFNKYQPQVVFHAAAHKHVPLMEHSPEEAIKNNIFGTENVVEIAHQSGVERFVLISTDKAVNPTNVMGATKRAAEMVVEAYNQISESNFMAVRFGNVLDSEGSVVPIFKQQIAEGGPVTVTHPDVKRYFMTISEAVQLVIQAASLGQGGEVFVLDMGEPVKIIDLAHDLIRLSGLQPEKDIEIEFTGLRPGEKLFEELLNDDEDNLSTEHERIFIANLEEVEQQKLGQALKKLQKMVKENGHSQPLIMYLSNLVQTYTPQREGFPVDEEEQDKRDVHLQLIQGEKEAAADREE